MTTSFYWASVIYCYSDCGWSLLTCLSHHQDYHQLLMSICKHTPSRHLIPILKSTLRSLSVPLASDLKSLSLPFSSDQRHQLAALLFLSVFGPCGQVQTQQQLISVVISHWGHIKFRIEETVASKDLFYMTNIFVVLVLIHNWMHDPRMFKFLKENGEFDFFISVSHVSPIL